MRKIAIPQFYRGRDIYEDELGWQENEKDVFFILKYAQKNEFATNANSFLHI